MRSLEEHPIFSLFLCVKCNQPRITQGRFDHQKAKGLKHTCAPCGDILATAELKRKQSRVIPINKSTPTYIHSRETLCQLNPKRTT
jgi:ribosomal protein S27E